jgi:hypothetical protein
MYFKQIACILLGIVLCIRYSGMPTFLSKVIIVESQYLEGYTHNLIINGAPNTLVLFWRFDEDSILHSLSSQFTNISISYGIVVNTTGYISIGKTLEIYLILQVGDFLLIRSDQMKKDQMQLLAVSILTTMEFCWIIIWRQRQSLEMVLS